jgi:hypothetical protein
MCHHAILFPSPYLFLIGCGTTSSLQFAPKRRCTRFLLQRLQDIAKGHDFVHVDDDIRTNAAFLDSSRAVYFQGNNLLVKIDGTDNSTEGACLNLLLKMWL